jgi:riboflavin kinase / FMN adenylyltransferase
MKIIEGRLENIAVVDELSIALGTFDGVHRGHQEIIRNAVLEANKRGIKSSVFTFNKHPISVLRPEKEIDILTDNKTKAAIIQSLGVDYLFFAEFNNDFAGIEPEEFLKFLKNKLNARVLLCGFNYTFGRLGKGDTEFLEDNKDALELSVNIIDKVSYENKNISSSIIREKIKNGLLEEANELLGYNYFYSGMVIQGKQLGRKLGFPTANIEIPGNLSIKNGIYITLTHIDGKAYPSVSNLGYIPTFNANNRSIETHVLDYENDLYGKLVKVEFLRFVRPEMKFDSLEKLKVQVFNDIDSARNYFGI